MSVSVHDRMRSGRRLVRRSSQVGGPVGGRRERSRAVTGGSGVPWADFEDFFERTRAGLGRFSLLLAGDTASAEDLMADVFLMVWRQWETVSTVEEPLAYVRRMMVNTAASRTRRLLREQRRNSLALAGVSEAVRDPDGAESVDVRAALMRLPLRRRACVVLRHAFDLSEAETAAALVVSVGTVKSQTSKGVAQLQRLLSDEGRWTE
jgi:RNA polymerase sigma-70 factor (sigma-E family)